MIKKILLCASAIALIASCTDEDSAWTTDSFEVKTVLPENDLTFGYNSILTETDSLSTVSIPLNTDVAPVISCSRGVADLQCVNIDGKYYLQVANPEKAKMGVDEVTLTVKGHPELTKSFFFTVNKSLNKTRASAPTGQDAKIKQRFAKIFSQGQYVWKGPSDDHPIQQIFDPDKLYASLTDSFPLFRLDDNFVNKEELQKSSGSTEDEHNYSWSANIGVSNIPIGTKCASLSGEAMRKDKDYSKHYFEYLTESRYHCTAAATLTVSMLSTEAHDTLWKHLITPELDNVLNNPGSKEYKRYPDNDEGACKLIEDYGSHLVTFCMLGTKATLNFRKKQDLQKTSVEWTLGAKIQQVSERKNLKDIDDKDKLAIAKYVDDQSFSACAGYSKSYDDFLAEVEATWEATLMGGNANTAKDFADWNATDDPEKWIPVAYNKGNKQHAELRAIYELCQDPTSPRCQLLKRVMEEVDKKTGHCPFIDYMIKEYKINPNPKETEWVLAGVYVDVTVKSDKDDDGNQNEIPKPIRRSVPGDEKTKATFYPFTDLAFSKGNCLDTQTYDFGACVRKKCHYWYYAMMMRDDYPGIEDFKLVEKSKVSEYNLKKEYQNCLNGDEFGDGWRAGETGNYVLMCKPIKEGDTTTRPLTGFRLEAYDHYKDEMDDWSGKSTDEDDYRLLAVSCPTNCGLGGVDKNYKTYWWPRERPFPGYKYTVETVKDNNDKVRSVYHLQLIHQPYHLYLSTTAEKVQQADLHIEFPTNMREKVIMK